MNTGHGTYLSLRIPKKGMESTTKQEGLRAVYSFDHFGKHASFDDQQAIVVEALINDFLKMVRKWVFTDIEREELEEKLKAKELELQELQKFIDASISNLDPDRR